MNTVLLSAAFFIMLHMNAGRTVGLAVTRDIIDVEGSSLRTYGDFIHRDHLYYIRYDSVGRGPIRKESTKEEIVDPILAIKVQGRAVVEREKSLLNDPGFELRLHQEGDK